MSDYAIRSTQGYEPDQNENVLSSIFKQYESVIVQSLITSFGLDFLITDRHGGDVDTIHNVRQIGSDPEMQYKNAANKAAYDNRGEYNSSEYHSDPRYIAKNRQISEQKKNGELYDSYTGEKIAYNEKSDLDHVISAKEIHDDRGRVLAGLSGTDLANSEENLQATNPHTNRTKKADSMDKFLDKHGDEYSDEQKANMRQKDRESREAYEAKLAKAYYTSPAFAKDVAKAAGTVGVQMGLRQAVGFLFAEIWFSIKEEFHKLNVQPGWEMDLGDFFTAIGNGIKNGFNSAKTKYKEMFSKFLEGTISGAISSVTTSLCNIFFTTAKNVVTIIRQSWASVVEAAKILFINPDGYLFGDRLRAAAKVLATGASVVVGGIVSAAIGATPVGTIPVIGNIIQTFCGTLVSGVMSCTLLYFLDRSKLVNKLVDFLNSLRTVDQDIAYYKQQAVYFEEYAAKLMDIDIDTFKLETEAYSQAVNDLDSARSERELNTKLYSLFDKQGIKMSWQSTHDSFDSFMRDKSAILRFE